MIAINFPLPFLYCLVEQKRGTNSASAIVRRAIILWEAIQKRSNELMYKSNTKKA